MTSFLGKPVSFWIAWNEQMTELNLERVMTINAIYHLSLSLIEEIVKPRETGSRIVDYFKIQEILNVVKKSRKVRKMVNNGENQEEN